MRIPVKKNMNNRGFTLMEVIAVLIVLGIISAVAVSRISFSGNELVTETDLLKSNLRFAQVKALTNNDDTTTTWGIKIAGDGKSYTLQKNGADVSVSFPFGGSTHELSSDVTITVPANVTYDFWGSPGLDNIPITLSQGGKTASFTITSNTGYIQ
jgi:MSHA pilin protein MshC